MFGISASYPVDDALLKAGLSKRKINAFWNDLRKKLSHVETEPTVGSSTVEYGEAMKYFEDLLNFDVSDEYKRTDFKIRKELNVLDLKVVGTISKDDIIEKLNSSPLGVLTDKRANDYFRVEIKKGRKLV